jgi:hypothetical protein
MPAWNNNDTANSKPKWDVERQVREHFIGTTANTTNGGNTVITLTYYDGTVTSSAINVISIGDTVSTANVGVNGYPGFFQSNTRVTSINGNNIVLSGVTQGNLASGSTIEFDTPIAYPSAKAVEKTYNQDTILVTATRAANGNNAIANVGNMTTGWVHIQKKTNSDGTVRYLKETLVALANATASNTSSGNTSFGSIVTGV